MRPLIAAAAMALTVLEPGAAAEPELKITRAGTRAVHAAPAQNFTGTVKVEMKLTANVPRVCFNP